MRTAVVLGAGGLVGQAFHLGVLTALAEVTGFDARQADILVGTSAGSLVAAGLAGGLSAHDLRAELLGEPLSEEGRRIRRARPSMPRMPTPAAIQERRGPLAPQAVLAAARRPWGVRPGALASSLLPAGRMATETIARGLQRLHGGAWPERELRICALRARDARRVVFGTDGAPRTDVGSAVAASCAVPGYFAPVTIDGEVYVDGGGHSPTNADVVAGDAPGLVVVSSPMSVGRTAALRPRVDLGVRHAVRRYLAREVRMLRRRGARVVVLQPGPHDLRVMGLNPMLGGRVDEVITTVAASTRTRFEAQPAVAALLAAD
jgi:NTE family protein